jgi:hypothetical protein
MVAGEFACIPRWDSATQSDDAEDGMTPGETPERDDAVHGLVPKLAERLPMADRISSEMLELADDIGKEGEAEDRLLDGIRRAVSEQPSAVGDRVDLTAIIALEPDFDPTAFRTIARETFLKVREARSTRREQEDDGLMTAVLERKIDDEIFSDAAARHSYVFSGLEVAEATIVSATVEEGREKLTVRFVATAERIEVDELAGRIVSDDGSPHRFTEVWRFERDPAADGSATDARHTASVGPDNWLFAHRGWVVTDVQSTD